MKKPSAATTERTQWFREARFGMFIHWGLYALPARGEWVMNREALPAEVYNRLADRFHPEGFDPASWVDLARRAGQRYMVLTTRHHDGFALFDSQASDFTSVKTAAKRDFVREYAQACRAAGLKVGFYYSIMSWQFPAAHLGPLRDPAGWQAMVEQTHEQVRELMTNYGQVDVLWYDGCSVPGIADPELVSRYWRSRELNAMVRKLQPQILINDRSARPEDFSTPEQHVTPPQGSRLWEACMTLNRSWGFNKSDRNFKSVEALLRHLTYCARFGGNLLLNIGPRADGSVPAESVRRLEAMGQWLETNGEAVYGSERLPITATDQVIGPVTAHGRRLYLPLFDWPGKTARLAGLQGEVTATRFLGEAEPAPVLVQSRGGLADLSGLPPRAPRAATPPPVLCLELAPGTRLRKPAAVLGLGQGPRVEAGDAPILEVGSSHWSFPPEPVARGEELAPRATAPGGLELRPTESFCPGWRQGAVLVPATGEMTLTVEVPVSGQYELALGVVAGQTASVELDLAGATIAKRLAGGYPDTLRLPALRLKKGRHPLTFSAGSGVGLYALQVTPIWRPIPMEEWLTIGPFPTAFAAMHPVSEIRDALRKVFPPEREFDPQTAYPGAGGRPVRWHANRRRGQRAALGVNFNWTFDRQTYGPCYARTVILSPESRQARIAIGSDWWAKAWLNGRRLRTDRDPAALETDGADFCGSKPLNSSVRLQAGENVLLVKNHPGTGGNEFTCWVSDPGDVAFSK